MPRVGPVGSDLLGRCEPALLVLLVESRRIALAEHARLICLRHIVSAAFRMEPKTTRRALHAAGILVSAVEWCLEEFPTPASAAAVDSLERTRLSGRLATVLSAAERDGVVTLERFLASLTSGPLGPSSTPTAMLLEACRLR